VVKGFLIVEVAAAGQKIEGAAAPCDGPSLLALRHWWNDAAGTWLDFTPLVPGEQAWGGTRLLVEAASGDKPLRPLGTAGRAFACALAARLSECSDPAAVAPSAAAVAPSAAAVAPSVPPSVASAASTAAAAAAAAPPPDSAASLMRPGFEGRTVEFLNDKAGVAAAPGMAGAAALVAATKASTAAPGAPRRPPLADCSNAPVRAAAPSAARKAPPPLLPEAPLPEAPLPEACLPEACPPEACPPEACPPEACPPEACPPEACPPEAAGGDTGELAALLERLGLGRFRSTFEEEELVDVHLLRSMGADRRLCRHHPRHLCCRHPRHLCCRHLSPLPPRPSSPPWPPPPSPPRPLRTAHAGVARGWQATRRTAL